MGTDVQISCSDGKIFFHQVALRKFTNILDFATSDEVHQLKDPWGTLTIVVPHLKMEVLTPLGEFIYRGETGKVSNSALQNVLAYIRPELGESIEVQATTVIVEKTVRGFCSTKPVVSTKLVVGCNLINRLKL